MFPQAARYLALASAVAGLCACVESFEVHDEFAHLHYLCTGDNAQLMTAQVDECRAAREAGEQCGGVISMMGTLQGVELTLESRLEQSVSYMVKSSGEEHLHRLDMSGASPYFLFVLRLYSLGGVMSADLDPAAPSRSLRWSGLDEQKISSLEQLDDELIGGNIRFETEVESLAVSAQPGTGGLDLSLVGPGEVAGVFEMELDLETSRLEGCFHTFFTGRREAELTP